MEIVIGEAVLKGTKSVPSLSALDPKEFLILFYGGSWD
jgi:hypothetical protein